jgi:hypothetical protein
MKTLKFRVWDSISKKMHPWEIVNLCPVRDFHLEHYTVLFFTGFKDCKGNDIYDGDIISDTVIENGKELKSKQQVFWSEGTGMWRLDSSFEQDKTYTEPLYSELRDYKYEIIGNIYENAK